MSRDRLGLFDTPPDRQQLRFCVAIVGLLFIGFLLILPVRDIRLGEVPAFIPVIDAAMVIGELITAALLCGQAIVFRSRALNVLATGYTLTAWLCIPHALTFPGAFASHGLLDAGVNTAGAISYFRRAVFPIAIILYVMRKGAEPRALPETRPMWVRIIVANLAAIALATALGLLATKGHDLLPTFLLNRSNSASAVEREAVVLVLFLVATVTLFRQRNSILDSWLLVGLAAWLIQDLVIMTIHTRFTVGWYFLYALTLFSQLVVLFALIAESIRLYARLAVSISARQRERDARLITIDAVTSAISHEVGQPLAAVDLNATAALIWLDHTPPNPEKIGEFLQRTIDAARRSSEVIKSIRDGFRKGSPGVTEFSLNDLVRKTASLLDRELAAERVSLQLALDEALPPILADRVQMQRVLVNLFTNAIESLRTTRGRSRSILVRSEVLDGDDVLLEVSDTGIGIAPDQMERIFEHFFTTKASGTGLGLAICRFIVEEHGGRLWASPGEKHGATFNLKLPRSRPLIMTEA